jgi:DNA-directed RNA polymerase subunit beta'
MAGEPGRAWSRPMLLSSATEASTRSSAGVITYHSQGSAPLGRFVDRENGNARIEGEIHDTTPGRVILGRACCPESEDHLRRREPAEHDQEGHLGDMIDAVYRNCGQKETVIFCDRSCQLGFYHAFKAGISFGKDDMVVPEKKWRDRRSDEAHAREGEFEQQYNDGLITQARSTTRSSTPGSVHGPDRQGDDGRASPPCSKGPDAARPAGFNSIYMMSALGRPRIARRR